ncbi:hypothetical protein [Acinetobacter venetianus]|uniref:hypothetical protein n=1 Tax=Acinetobacter venetianus TaxID=52133 RepID=UPI00384BBC1C
MGDEFGDVPPTGNLVFLIRHAGQYYYDQEVNLFYNYFHDYDLSNKSSATWFVAQGWMLCRE